MQNQSSLSEKLENAVRRDRIHNRTVIGVDRHRIDDRVGTQSLIHRPPPVAAIEGHVKSAVCGGIDRLRVLRVNRQLTNGPAWHIRIDHTPGFACINGLYYALISRT